MAKDRIVAIVRMYIGNTFSNPYYIRFRTVALRSLPRLFLVYFDRPKAFRKTRSEELSLG